jgi:hypothetical protein
VELQVRLAVPEFVMVLGVIAPQVRFAGTVSVKEIVPVNPLSADTVMVQVAGVPALGSPAGQEAAMVKSVKLKVAVVE